MSLKAENDTLMFPGSGWVTEQSSHSGMWTQVMSNTCRSPHHTPTPCLPAPPRPAPAVPPAPLQALPPQEVCPTAHTGLQPGWSLTQPHILCSLLHPLIQAHPLPQRIHVFLPVQISHASPETRKTSRAFWLLLIHPSEKLSDVPALPQIHKGVVCACPSLTHV